jgi:hypothetical protein
MNNVVVKLNLPGINEVMKSSGIQEATKEAAEVVRSMAGDGYEVRPFIGNWIAGATVYTEDPNAKKDNLANNTLVKALSASGLHMSK